MNHQVCKQPLFAMPTSFSTFGINWKCGTTFPPPCAQTHVHKVRCGLVNARVDEFLMRHLFVQNVYFLPWTKTTLIKGASKGRDRTDGAKCFEDGKVRKRAVAKAPPLGGVQATLQRGVLQRGVAASHRPPERGIMRELVVPAILRTV